MHHHKVVDYALDRALALLTPNPIIDDCDLPLFLECVHTVLLLSTIKDEPALEEVTEPFELGIFESNLIEFVGLSKMLDSSEFPKYPNRQEMIDALRKAQHRWRTVCELEHDENITW
jgi:hypothetical protein